MALCDRPRVILFLFFSGMIFLINRRLLSSTFIDSQVLALLVQSSGIVLLNLVFYLFLKGIVVCINSVSKFITIYY